MPVISYIPVWHNMISLTQTVVVVQLSESNSQTDEMLNCSYTLMSLSLHHHNRCCPVGKHVEECDSLRNRVVLITNWRSPWILRISRCQDVSKQISWLCEGLSNAGRIVPSAIDVLSCERRCPRLAL